MAKVAANFLLSLKPTMSMDGESFIAIVVLTTET